MNSWDVRSPGKRPAKKGAGGGLVHVIAEVKGLSLAVCAECVQEIVRVPPWHGVAGAPRHIRGVVNLRGRVLPLVDLRVLLDLSSALDEVEEMIAMLAARERDHVLWLQELKAAVGEGRPFLLARDPTECAFGRWYYRYRPEDIGFASVMCRLELPHRRIHAVADAVLKLAEQGAHDRAQELIQRTERGDLSTVVALFAEARAAYRESRKEVALVLTDHGRRMAVAVDRVVSVEALAAETIADADDGGAAAGARSDLLGEVSHRAGGQGTVFLLDAKALLGRR